MATIQINKVADCITIDSKVYDPEDLIGQSINDTRQSDDDVYLEKIADPIVINGKVHFHDLFGKYLSQEPGPVPPVSGSLSGTYVLGHTDPIELRFNETVYYPIMDTENLTWTVDVPTPLTSCHYMLSNGIYNFNGIASVDLSELDTSQVTDMMYMFCNAIDVQTLDVSNIVTENVTTMYGMFYSCNDLTSIVGLNSFNTSNVNDMSFMFYMCRSLTSLDVSRFNTSNVTGMIEMFNNCSSLTSLDLSNFDTSNVTEMRSMFSGCSGLTSIIGLNNFNTSNVTDMSSMFSGCSGLTSIDVTSFASASFIANSMFYGCSSLNEIIGSEGLIVTSSYGMFKDCSSLVSIDISSMDLVSTDMFIGCSSLASVKVASWSAANKQALVDQLNSYSAGGASTWHQDGDYLIP